MKNLLTAVYSKTSGSALSTDVGGRIFLDEAPSGCEFPYCVFSIISGVPDDVFNKKGRNVLIQFDLFSSSSGATEITTMYNDLHSLFDDQTLTIPPTGTVTDTLIWMHETNVVTMVEEITTAAGLQTVKHWAADYELITEAA